MNNLIIGRDPEFVKGQDIEMSNTGDYKASPEDSKGCCIYPSIANPYDNNSNKDSNKKETEEITEAKDDVSWKAEWWKWSQETTLHGFVHITEHTRFPLRRIGWAIVLIVATGMFVYQVTDRIQYLSTFPVAVNLEITHNDSVRFPAVVICNQNTFRLSKAYQLGIYHKLADAFSFTALSDFNISKYNTWNTSIMEMYEETSHTKENMIFNCKWRGKNCKEQFTQIVTEYGICYAFNADPSSPEFTSYTGTQHGLQLHLNVEEYEYMPGPNGGAGLKFLLYDPREFPSVKELGLAVPTGSHTFIGLKFMRIKNLPKMYGDCDESRTLKYFPSYTMSGCQTECKTIYVIKHCGCRDIFMPGEAPFCSIQKYFNCVLLAYDILYKNKEFCNCTVPCDAEFYVPTSTYASTTTSDAASVLKEDLSDLSKQYVLAREITQKVDNYTMALDKVLTFKIEGDYQKMKAAVEYSKAACVTVENLTDISLGRLNPRMNFHLNGALDRVEYIISHEYVRGYDVGNERTYVYTTTGFLLVSKMMEGMMEMMEANDTTEGVKDAFYVITLKDLLQKSALAERTLVNMTQVYEAYTTGIKIVNYKTTYDERYDSDLVDMKYLNHSYSDLNNYWENLKNSLNRYINSLEGLKNVTNQIYRNGTYDIYLYQRSINSFVYYGKRINYELFRIRDRIIYKSETLVQETIDDFTKLRDIVYLHKDNLKKTCAKLKQTVQEFDISSAIIEEGLQIARYNLHYSNLTKEKVARFILADAFQNGVVKIHTILLDLRQQGREVADHWKNVEMSVKSVWSNMLQETATAPLYEHLGKDIKIYNENETQRHYLANAFSSKLLRVGRSRIENMTLNDLTVAINADFPDIVLDKKINEITDFFQSAKNIDIVKAVGNKEETFKISSQILSNKLKGFLESIEINSQFVRKNFLEVNIYMQELSYELVEQIVAYDFISLLSDIGGSVGLFIGASVLTIFEFFDVIFHTLARKYLS